MITGDNALTAVHVAREVEIVKREVLIADVWDESKGLEFRSIDESKSFTIDVSSAIPSEKKILDYDLCITGRGLVEVIDTPSWTGYLLPRLWVYARVSPSQKVSIESQSLKSRSTTQDFLSFLPISVLQESILMSLKSAGYSTLMCGDGTNDVGALKQSHVGK